MGGASGRYLDSRMKQMGGGGGETGTQGNGNVCVLTSCNVPTPRLLGQRWPYGIQMSNKTCRETQTVGSENNQQQDDALDRNSGLKEGSATCKSNVRVGSWSRGPHESVT